MKFRIQFVVSPAQWSSFATTAALDWRSVEFAANRRDDVPTERGVYAFVIGSQNDQGLPPHGYPMYIGQTGHGSKQTLRDRFGGYLAEQKSDKIKRVKVKTMLTKWKNNLYFYYATVPDRRYSLRKLEAALNDALVPPMSTNDFSAELRPAVRAL